MSKTKTTTKETEPIKEVKEIFSGEHYCVAVNLNGGVSDGFLYVAEYGQDGKPGKVHRAEKVWSEADYGRSKAVCEALAKYLDLLKAPPIGDDSGANAAIIRSLPEEKTQKLEKV